MTVTRLGLVDSLVREDRLPGAGCWQVWFSARFEGRHRLGLGAAGNLTYSFGVPAGARGETVSHCLDGPCEYSPKLAGGVDAPFTGFIVSLQSLKNRHFCGATLVTGRVAVTAAHCAPAVRRGAYAVAGALDLADAGSGVQTVVSAVAWHARYSPNDRKANDIALVRGGTYGSPKPPPFFSWLRFPHTYYLFLHGLRFFMCCHAERRGFGGTLVPPGSPTGVAV